MTRALAVGAAAAAALLLGAADGAAVSNQNPTLFGTVGPGFAITLEDARGYRVTELVPGAYDIEVEDLSEFHSFHLEGPGVDRATAIDGTGKETWTVVLQAGSYVYHCDVHPSSMRGTVVAAYPPPPPPSQSSAITAKTKLVLTSGPGFTITLTTAAGKSFKSMKRGTYTVVVRDRSRLHSAHVKAPGFNRATGIPYVGAQTWKVKLAKVGTLRFLCDAHPASMRGSRKIV